MDDIVTTFFIAQLLPYVIAVVMPTWRWLVGITLVVVGVLYAGWPPHWIALLLPGADEEPGGGVASALTYCATVGFATGVLVCGLTILLGSWGLRRRTTVAICIAGVVIGPALIIFAPGVFSLF